MIITEVRTLVLGQTIYSVLVYRQDRFPPPGISTEAPVNSH